MRPRVLWVLVVLAGLGALALSLTVFRHGSLNNDESAYLLQAEGLLRGRLIEPTGAGDASQPWLFAPVAGGYASKYLPVVAAVYAPGLLIADSIWPVTVLLAGSVPWLVHRLARRCGIAEGRALVAAALVTLSPVTLVQGGVALSYLPFLVTLLITWLLAVRLRQGAGPAWLPGLTAGLGFTMRPLDAVLLLVPVVLWAARGRALAYAVAGAAPVGLLAGAYDWRVTGSPLRLPFNLLTGKDDLGFGDRRLIPENTRNDFGPLDGLHGLGEHFLLGPATWFACSLAVAVLAGAALVQRRASRPSQVLALTCLPFLLAYAAFWGPWVASVQWGGTRVMGPFYALPLLPVLALLAVQAALSARKVAVALAVVSLLGNAVQATRSLQQAGRDGARSDEVVALAEAALERGPLLVGIDPPYLGSPVSRVSRLLQPGGPSPLLASQLAPGQRPAVAELLQLPEYPYLPGLRLSYRLVEVAEEQSSEPALRVARAGDGEQGEVLVVERAGRRTACAVDSRGARLVLTASGVTGCDGAPVPRDEQPEPWRGCPSASCLTVTSYVPQDGELVRVAWRRLVLDQRGEDWVVPVDGATLAERGAGWLAVWAG